MIFSKFNFPVNYTLGLYAINGDIVETKVNSATQ